MVREVIRTGRTVDAAVESACEEIGLPREEVEIEILDLPRKCGFLHLKVIPAKVRVYVTLSKEVLAENFLNQVFSDMGVPVTISSGISDGILKISLEGEGLGFIIGRHGETLDSLQYLTSLVANKYDGDFLRVVLDSGNYREKRVKTLEALAKKIAYAVIKSGKPSSLEPMAPYERRIIHATISNINGALSTSNGLEPYRYVVVSPKKKVAVSFPKTNNNKPRGSGKDV